MATAIKTRPPTSKMGDDLFSVLVREKVVLHVNCLSLLINSTIKRTHPADMIEITEMPIVSF